MWKIGFTTRLLVKPILHAELYFRIPKELAAVLYLGINTPITVHGGQTIPLNHSNGSFRNDKKKLRDAHLMGITASGSALPSEESISKQHGDVFVHAFIVNNFSTSTPQQTFIKVLAESIKRDYGFDFDQVDATNLVAKNSEFQKLLQNKDLECRWSKWIHPVYDTTWCYGPNGDHLRIV